LGLIFEDFFYFADDTGWKTIKRWLYEINMLNLLYKLHKIDDIGSIIAS